MRALIIAGGKGTRLRPITYETPKPLVPFQGRKLVDHVIDLFWKYKIYEVWFSVGYKGNQIIEEYPTAPCIVEQKQQGTGGWLKQIKEDKPSRKQWSTPFFACNADNLFDLDLHSMLQNHMESDAVATLACTKVDDVSQYGAVHIEDGLVQSFEEKKKSNKKKPGWISGGYYLFSPEIFDYIPDELPISLENDVFPEIAKDGKLNAFKSDGQWFDVGTMDKYKKALDTWDGIQ